MLSTNNDWRVDVGCNTNEARMDGSILAPLHLAASVPSGACDLSAIYFAWKGVLNRELLLAVEGWHGTVFVQIR